MFSKREKPPFTELQFVIIINIHSLIYRDGYFTKQKKQNKIHPRSDCSNFKFKRFKKHKPQKQQREVGKPVGPIVREMHF